MNVKNPKEIEAINRLDGLIGALGEIPGRFGGARMADPYVDGWVVAVTADGVSVIIGITLLSKS